MPYQLIQDSDSNIELPYPPGGFNLDDSVTNFVEDSFLQLEHRPQRTASNLDYSRFVAATKNLQIIHHDMAAWCRQLMRSFVCRPVAMHTVCTVNVILTDLCDELVTIFFLRRKLNRTLNIVSLL